MLLANSTGSELEQHIRQNYHLLAKNNLRSFEIFAVVIIIIFEMGSHYTLHS